MISDSKKFIFIHIPKSGGTSVNAALKEYCEYPPELSPGVRNTDIPYAYEKHNNIATIKEHHTINIDQYFKFATVRNPWDRILSLYFHRIQLVSRAIDMEQPGFNEWVKNVFLNEKTHRYWVNQFDYISIDNVIVADYIIRFEDILSGWSAVCKKLEIQVDLPHTYKTEHDHYTKYYDEESKISIEKMFIRDIEYFNYKF